jgi:hypothetical protein
MLRRLIAVVALAIVALPACATSGADRVGTTTITSGTVDHPRGVCTENEPGFCVFDSDCCGDLWCIRGTCQ